MGNIFLDSLGTYAQGYIRREATSRFAWKQVKVIQFLSLAAISVISWGKERLSKSPWRKLVGTRLHFLTFVEMEHDETPHLIFGKVKVFEPVWTAAWGAIEMKKKYIWAPMSRRNSEPRAVPAPWLSPHRVKAVYRP